MSRDRLGQRCAMGPFLLDVNAAMLSLGEEPVSLGRRAVAVLLLLLERPGEVVTKDELIAGAWNGLVVEESNLTAQIAGLRRAFAVAPEAGGWIETLARRGYRFMGPVRWEEVRQGSGSRRSGGRESGGRGSGGRESGIGESGLGEFGEHGLEVRGAVGTTLAADRGRPSLAVLPFRTPAPDAIPRYIADGLVEDVISALAGLSELTVISRGSTFRFRDTELGLPEIGRDLGVRYVVSGSLRRAGDRIRVLGELAEASTGAVLSSRAFEGTADMMFDTQDRMVGEIVRTLAPKVRSEELRRIRIKAPENLVAYDCVLQARELIYRLDRQGFEQARAMLDRAIGLDPSYAAAYALMAEYYSLRVGQNWSVDRTADAEAAERFAQQAIERDPSNVRAMARYAHGRAFLNRDHQAAVALFELALDGSPNNADVWMWSSCTYAYLGDGAEAIRRGELGLRLSPRDWFGFQFHSTLCLAHYVNGSFAEAVRSGMASIAENPRYVSNLRYTAAALVAAGEVERGRALGRELMALEPELRVGAYLARHPFSEPALRHVYGRHLVQAGLPE